VVREFLGVCTPGVIHACGDFRLTTTPFGSGGTRFTIEIYNRQGSLAFDNTGGSAIYAFTSTERTAGILGTHQADSGPPNSNITARSSAPGWWVWSAFGGGGRSSVAEAAIALPYATAGRRVRLNSIEVLRGDFCCLRPR
jgi:hypothetical protein